VAVYEDLDEPDVYDGMRAFPVTQQLWATLAPSTVRWPHVKIGWYDESFDNRRGAFCWVASDSEYEDLTGDFLRFTYARRKCTLYCLGDQILPTGVSILLARRAFMQIAPLWKITIGAMVEVMR
jgi:hypothetical protein